MRPMLIAAALALLAAAPVQAQNLDASKPETPKAASKASCHTADGKAQPCAQKTARRAPKTRVATPMITRCRDVVSHQLAKCGGPTAEPVPAN